MCDLPPTQQGGDPPPWTSRVSHFVPRTRLTAAFVLSSASHHLFGSAPRLLQHLSPSPPPQTAIAARYCSPADLEGRISPDLLTGQFKAPTRAAAAVPHTANQGERHRVSYNRAMAAMHGTSSTAFGVLAASAVLLALATPSNGLSFELCNNYGSEWVTDSPHLTGKFPYYSLIFSCMGGLNIEGKDVDACINNGTDCGLPAADAWCKYIGFDGATPDMAQTAPADQPVRAVTGEWCVSAGNYQNLGALNRTQFDDLATVNANKQHCNKLDSATCFRRRETMGTVFAELQANATQGVSQTPVQQSVIKTAAAAGAPASAEPANMAVTAVGGRRLKGFADFS